MNLWLPFKTTKALPLELPPPMPCFGNKMPSFLKEISIFLVRIGFEEKIVDGNWTFGCIFDFKCIQATNMRLVTEKKAKKFVMLLLLLTLLVMVLLLLVLLSFSLVFAVKATAVFVNVAILVRFWLDCCCWKRCFSSAWCSWLWFVWLLLMQVRYFIQLR